jgi:hypothetical protein
MSYIIIKNFLIIKIYQSFKEVKYKCKKNIRQFIESFYLFYFIKISKD